MNFRQVFIAVLILSLCSCSIQKRTFNKGYFVQWNSKSKTIQNKETPPEIVIDSKNINEVRKDSIIRVDDNKQTASEKPISSNSTSINYLHENIEHVKSERIPSPNLLRKYSIFPRIKFKTKTQNAQKDYNSPNNLKRIFYLTLLFIALGILFMILTLNSPLLIFKILNFVFAVLGLAGIIYYVKHTPKIPKKASPEDINKSNRRKAISIVIIFCILLLALLILLNLFTLAVLTGDFYYTYIGVFIGFLHGLILFLKYIVFYSKFLINKKESIDKTELKMFRKNIFRINIVFFILYVLFIAAILILLFM